MSPVRPPGAVVNVVAAIGLITLKAWARYYCIIVGSLTGLLCLMIAAATLETTSDHNARMGGWMCLFLAGLGIWVAIYLVEPEVAERFEVAAPTKNGSELD